MARSARYRVARKTAGSSSSVSSITVPSTISSAKASSMIASGISKSFTARGMRSLRGRPQCPSLTASISA